MTGPGRGALGAAVVAEHRLRPQDDETRRRMSELVAGIEPKSSETKGVETPKEALGDVRPTAAPTMGWRLRRLWRMVILIIRRVGVRRVGAVFVAGISAAGSVVGVAAVFGWAATLSVAVAFFGVAFALGLAVNRIREGRSDSVPSRLSSPTFEPRENKRQRPLDAPALAEDPPVEPLLVPRWTRGILTGALAVETNDGPLDVDRFVEALARLEVPARLPLRSRRSIDLGAQVLVDLSEDMLPFREDIRGILRRLRRIVGGDALTVLRFAGRPMTQIGPGRRATWGPYEPPRLAQPVLVISNFGSPMASADDIDPAESAWEWKSLVAELDRQHCPVVALVPGATDRVPAFLRRHMAVVEWDRTTTAASALRAVGA
jgi:hypothetical protein